MVILLGDNNSDTLSIIGEQKSENPIFELTRKLIRLLELINF